VPVAGIVVDREADGLAGSLAASKQNEKDGYLHSQKDTGAKSTSISSERSFLRI